VKAKNILSVAAVVLFGLILLAAALVLSQSVQQALHRRLEAKIKQNAADSFVVIRYHFKKSQRPRPPREEHAYEDHYDFNEGDVLDHILAKTTRDVVGVIVSEKGEVFTSEHHLWPDTIDKITVAGPDGTELEAADGRVLRNAPGQILQIKGDLPKTWKPLRFSPGPKALDMKSRLYVISLSMRDYHEAVDDREGRFAISPVSPVR